MRTKHLFLILFIFSSQKIYAQVTFLKQFTDIPIDFYISAYDFKQTSDSGYILTGFNMQNNQTSYGPFLIRLNINGDTVWTRHYDSGIGGISVDQTCDGGFVSMGGTGILKTDSNGDTLWSKYYSDMGGAIGYITSDCGYILLGNSNNIGAGQGDIYMIKTDSDGNPLWAKTYGGDSIDKARTVQQTTDGGYILGCTSNSFSLGNRIYIIKTNANGDTLWTKIYGLSGFTDIAGSAIIQTSDKGYVISGGENFASYLIKTDSSGNVVWSKSYGAIGGGSIMQTPDSGFVFTCFIGSFPDSILLVKTDINGNMLWHNAFAIANEFNDATPVSMTHDGGYAFGGTGTNLIGTSTETHAFVKKTDSNGLSCTETYPAISVSSTSIISSPTATIISSPAVTVMSPPPVTTASAIMNAFTLCSTVDIEEIQPSHSVAVNPSFTIKGSSISISLDEDLKNASVTIYNVMGVAIQNYTLTDKGKTVLLKFKNNLSPGMYFVRIMQGKRIIVKKIVVV